MNLTSLRRITGFTLVCACALAFSACGRGRAPAGGNNAGGGNANNASSTTNAGTPAQALASGKLDAEIAQLEAQAEKNPEDDAARTVLAAAYVRRGDALRSANRLDEAQRDFQTALRLDPGNDDAQLRLEQLNQEIGAEPRGDDGKPISVPAKNP